MAGLKFDDAFPRVIDSKTHSIIDWVHSAANFAAAGIFLARGNKKAAVGAAMLGADVLFNTLMTDYEYGVFRVWNFKVHGILDYSVAATSAALPALMGFTDTPEANFFYAQGAVETMTAGMTDYDEGSGAENPEHLGKALEAA
jgi:hypothetical protein